MAAVQVASTAILVAPGGVQRERMDAVDRARAFDNSYRASATGMAKRDWHFTTPPVPRATADTYETALAVVTAQSCSGDILNATVNCFTEITGWRGISAVGGQYVELSFVLHEA